MTVPTYAAIKKLLQERDFAGAERSAGALLREFPLDAQCWVFLGEALLHRGYGGMAGLAFDRARLLDPHAAWTDDAKAAVGQAPAGDMRIDIEVLLDVPRVTVAAAILAKDEIRCIERCLNSLQGAVDEIVVVDCGSTDGTREAVASFPGAKLVSFDWCDDFAAARNAGLPHIESDWVIWVDADESLWQEDAANIRTAAGLFDRIEQAVIVSAGIRERINGTETLMYNKSRMFPMNRGLRYRGRVHEQIGGGDDADSLMAIRKPLLIRFDHDGYEPSVMQRKNKLARNIRLLEMMLREEPDNPAWLFFYGREILASGEREKGLTSLRAAEEKAANAASFSRLVEVRLLLASVHLQAGELEAAEEACRRALEDSPDFPDALVMLAQIELKQAYRQIRLAESRLRRAKEIFPSYRGAVEASSDSAGWQADYLLAEAARFAGKPAQAKALYERVLAGRPDEEQVHKRLARIEEQRLLLNGVPVRHPEA
ncbi:glycosyltransferase [Paenibacillus sp. MBLB4367]|uniref:glycosyltransferase n=1 Tax=Paenibacillus sp. MBLB4367 TaxID=3384767 RepID=UPI0039080E66